VEEGWMGDGDAVPVGLRGEVVPSKETVGLEGIKKKKKRGDTS